MDNKQKDGLAEKMARQNDAYKKSAVPQVPLNSGSYVHGADMGPEYTPIIVEKSVEG
jgi:hypothetical protein